MNIQISKEADTWFKAHQELEKKHVEKKREVETNLIKGTPLTLDGKDMRLFKKIAAQIHLSATDQIRVVVSETIDAFKRDYKWLNVKPNTNKDLLHIYKHIYDEELIHQHIQKITDQIPTQQDLLLDELYKQGFAPTYLMHFYNSLIEEDIHYFEDNNYDYSFSKSIIELDNPTKEDLIQAVQVCPFNYEIYKQAYNHNLYTNDLETIRNMYEIRFKSPTKTIIDFETIVDPITQKKNEQVLQKAHKIADTVKDKDFGENLLKKYPNKSDDEIAHLFWDDSDFGFEEGLLTFILFCNILSLFNMSPPKNANRNSSSTYLENLLCMIIIDIVVIALATAHENRAKEVHTYTMTRKENSNISQTVPKTQPTTQKQSNPTPKKISFFEWILSLFK